MGGRGSGSWSRFGKQTTDSVKKIDIRFLKKQGWLRAGIQGRLSWSCGDKASGSVNYRVEPLKFVLYYKYRTPEADWIDFSETIRLSSTACNYGGHRYWFHCPRCDKRVGILYGADVRFLCRHCYDLNYASQNEDKFTRLMRKAHKVRDKLSIQAPADSDPSLLLKPKGMHWDTFERLCSEYRLINEQSYTLLLEQLVTP